MTPEQNNSVWVILFWIGFFCWLLACWVYPLQLFLNGLLLIAVAVLGYEKLKQGGES